MEDEEITCRHGYVSRYFSTCECAGCINDREQAFIKNQRLRRATATLERYLEGYNDPEKIVSNMITIHSMTSEDTSRPAADTL
jgi:hypothetical protein